MKTVFDNRMVAHVWAQQAQAEGRSSNGQFYFEGATIFSYGRHFPIATIKTTKDGRKYVLMTTRDYSITTSKHKGYAFSAVYHLPRFAVKDVAAEDVKGQFEQAMAECVAAAINEQAEGRRNHEKRALAHLQGAAHIAEKANEYAAFTGARWRLKGPAIDPATIEKAAKAKAKADAAKAARLAKEQAEQIAAWYAGEPSRIYRFDAACGGAALRVVGDELQTSHGARVPLAHAVKAFRFLKMVRERGEGWHHNGHSIRVGHFTVDSIAPNGDFKAGCHDIRWPEVERIARLVGVFDAPASDEALTLTYSAA